MSPLHPYFSAFDGEGALLDFKDIGALIGGDAAIDGKAAIGSLESYGIYPALIGGDIAIDGDLDCLVCRIGR